MDLPARSLQVSKHMVRVVSAASQLQPSQAHAPVQSSAVVAATSSSVGFASSPQARRTAAKLSASPKSTIRGGLDTLHDLLAQGFLTEAEFDDRMAVAGSGEPTTASESAATDRLPQHALDQLAQLDQMMEQGILTKAETEDRKALVMAECGVVATATPGAGVASSSPVPAHAPSAPVSNAQQMKIEKLKEMYNAGYITEEKFMQRIEEIRRESDTGAGAGVNTTAAAMEAAAIQAPAVAPSATTPTDQNAQDLATLTQLFSEGFMSAAEFSHRKAQVQARSATPQAPSVEATMAKVQEIQRLQQMVSMGVLSQAEFEILCKQKFAQ
jgi:Short C-terminal domain